MTPAPIAPQEQSAGSKHRSLPHYMLRRLLNLLVSQGYGDGPV